MYYYKGIIYITSFIYDYDVIGSAKHTGNRITRSLYKRADGKIINVDVNVDLNIMAKSKTESSQIIDYLRCRGLTIPKRLQVSCSTF